MRKNANSKVGGKARYGVLALMAVLPWAAIIVASPAQEQQKKRRSTDAPIAAQGKLGQDLFIAIGMRNQARIDDLLKGGADANSRNGLEFTPLYVAAATHQPAAMKALLASGAKADADSPYGTALTFAAMSGHTEGAKILIGKGADVNYARVDGATVLMMAAQAGNPTFISELLKNKVEVNKASYYGSSPLAYAARMGHTHIGQMLIEAGAKVDTVDEDKQTPLMLAAKAGHSGFVKLLLAKGAKVNIRDAGGRTPLMLAAAYGGSLESVQSLVEAGASTTAKDAKGWTAGAIAANRGYEDIAKALGTSDWAIKTLDPKTAASKSIGLLERSMVAFSEGTQCISCHQEGLGRMVTASAKLHGFSVSKEMEQAQIGRLRGAFAALKPLHEQAVKNPEVMKQLPLIEINEVNPGYGWMLAGMAAQNDTPTQATAAAAQVLARQQAPNGSWTFGMPRIPMQGSVFAQTALVVRSLATYSPRSSAAETKELFAKAKAWMLSTPAKTSDDLAFRLLGLKWMGTSVADRQTSIDDLLAAQLPDGGWAQMKGMRSDAYATGQALYALAVGGGIKTDSEVYQRGVKYLLRTQDADGSWFVNKRAVPANNYFDAKFPHGESQYSSFNGTSWAAMALLETLPKK